MKNKAIKNKADKISNPDVYQLWVHCRNGVRIEHLLVIGVYRKHAVCVIIESGRKARIRLEKFTQNSDQLVLLLDRWTMIEQFRYVDWLLNHRLETTRLVPTRLPWA